MATGDFQRVRHRHTQGSVQNDKTIAVSNGSFKKGWGAVAWTIEGGDTAGRLVGMSFTPGTDSNQSAFWSELAGIYGIVFTILHITKDWEPETWQSSLHAMENWQWIT